MARANKAVTCQQLQLDVDTIARHPSANFTQEAVVHRAAPSITLEPAPVELAEAEDDGPQQLFGRWLLARQDRGDWIDDLAKAARADRAFPKNGFPEAVHDRLAAQGADADTLEQLEDAERCWAPR